MRKKKWLGAIGGFLFVCICFGVMGLVVLGKLGYDEFLKSPRLTSVRYHERLSTTYQFSPDQEGYIAQNGYPPSFSILFYQEQGAGGKLKRSAMKPGTTSIRT